MAISDIKVSEKPDKEKDVLGKPVHIPNPVPVLEEVEEVPSTVKKVKVEKVYTNGTFLVKDGGKEHIVSIPVNREERPRSGDTVEVRFTGEKDAIVATLTKPAKKEAEPAKK